MKPLFDFFRSKFAKNKSYPRAYVVNVSIEHPQIIGGPFVKVKVAIDANDKEHARARLKKELRLIVGSAVKA